MSNTHILLRGVYNTVFVFTRRVLGSLVNNNNRILKKNESMHDAVISGVISCSV